MSKAFFSTAARALAVALWVTAAAAAAPAQITCPNPTPTPLVAAPVDVVLPSCEAANVQQFTVCEIRLTPTQNYSDAQAYTQIDVTALFTHNQTGTTKLVHGFYDRLPGGQLIFKVRFNASEPGNWHFQTQCAAGCTQPDSGLSKPGDLFVNANANENGFLRADTVNREKFIYDSGSYPFIWGQSYYHIITNNIAGGGWQTAVNTTRSRKMNKIRMLLYPWWNYKPYGDQQPYKSTSPTTPLRNELNLPHWQHMDEVVKYMYDSTDPANGRHDPVIAELILFKDPAKDSNGTVIDARRTFATAPNNDTVPVEDARYVKYAVARYGAFPNVIWALSNEYQFTNKTITYWNTVGDILTTTPAGLPNPYDPWMFRNNKQRATSIHRDAKDLSAAFEFFPYTWPAHAVTHFGAGNGTCRRCDGTTFACKKGDDWGYHSISQNIFRCSNGARRLKPVTNDEYGYIGHPGTDVGGFDRNKHRRAIWGIALAGGYGTAGDLTPDPNSCNAQPTIASNWVAQLAYGDIQRLSDFFTLYVPNWWTMTTPLNQASAVTVVSSADPNDALRVYALTKSKQYVYYAANGGTFRAQNLAPGNYTGGFYNTRVNATGPPTGVSFTIPAGGPFTRDFTTPTLDGNDWVLIIKAP